MKRAIVLAFGVAVGMIAQQLAGKAIRDAFFLTHFDAEVLPRAMAVAGLLSVGMVFLSSALYRRFEPQKVVPAVFAISAGVFALVWSLSELAPKSAAAVLFLHTSSVGAVAISGFWSVVNETFDPHTLKQSVGRIASGASAGGVLGGLLTWQGSSLLSLEAMMLVLVAVNLACAVGVAALGRGGESSRTRPASSAPVSALEVFEKTPYLRDVLAVVILLAVAAAAYDYAFKASAAEALEGSEALVSFFAVFYSAVGVCTFLVQAGLAGPFLKRVGLTGAVSSLPFVIVGFGALTLLEGTLWAYVLLRGVAAVAESSLYRSGYELLFTPLTPEKKRPTKSLIDVGGDKLGVSLGSVLALFVVGLAPQASKPLLLLLAIGCGLGAAFFARRLYRGYISALTDALQRGAVQPDTVQLADPGTAGAVERTLALQRGSELRPLAQSVGARGLAEHGLASTTEDVAVWALPPEVAAWAQDSAYDLPAFAALESADPDARRRALARHRPLPAHLVPPTLGLLAHPNQAALARKALAPVAAAHVGQLGDALLDLGRPLEIRAALVELLASVQDRRAAEVLLHALASRPQSIRLRAAFSLSKLARYLPELAAEARLIERIRVELARYPPALSSPWRRRVVLAFTIQLLSISVPRATLGLAARAVSGGQGRSSGTGREYLDNVVPSELLEPLLLLLPAPGAADIVEASEASEVLRGGTQVDSLARLRARLGQWHPAFAGAAV
ncbi:MAG: hypothetical protein AAF851_05530 [Myxococcota bacterium]